MKLFYLIIPGIDYLDRLSNGIMGKLVDYAQTTLIYFSKTKSSPLPVNELLNVNDRQFVTTHNSTIDALQRLFKFIYN
ncbi:hypothetical protein RIR_jg22578.t1 [Rhizophagus irregularis DAOM 181602=DAOM 197198]|uniref:Uncharacterized protein n=1 Tax=Rhizophagus irregularis (strain DAOM 181602 / DAOM 197198 / MUCL 43194) TaxID=747089 RepID=U9TYC3_RHIID|nr:hypothetical protein RIR_jg22578.t1 [Rhizophagus irregularis DAOM 181602=DAOM 197198]